MCFILSFSSNKTMAKSISSITNNLYNLSTVLQSNIGYVEGFCLLFLRFFVAFTCCSWTPVVWLYECGSRITLSFRNFSHYVLPTTIVYYMKFYFQPSKLHYQVIFLHINFTTFSCFDNTFHFFIIMLLIYLCYKERMGFFSTLS
jgi:hypothetical protein